MENTLKHLKIWSLATLVCCLLFLSCKRQSENQKSIIHIDKTELKAIAISHQSSEREIFAANELVDYLHKITGKELQIIKTENSEISEGVIAIGNLAVKTGIITQTELNSISQDGFIIKVNDNKGALCGWRDLGTIYGVYELLRQVGVKFYAQDCEIIPNNSNLTISELNLSIKPHYDLRSIFKLDVYFPDMKPSMKLGYTPNDDLGYHGDLGAPEERNWVHSASFLMPYRIFGKEHPEYFALQKNGRRYTPGDGPPGHLCLSDENMRKAGIERLFWLIEQQKERSYLVITQGDGHPKWWCQCLSCQKLDAIPGVHMTDRLMDYINYNAREVEKKFPGKKILTLAYTEATIYPPKKILPDSNVMIMVCPLHCPDPPESECHSHGLECENNLWFKKALDEWVSLCPDNIYIFDYPRGYRVWYEPFGSFYAMVDKMDYYSEIGVRGIVYCVVPTNFRDLFMYIQGKLLWNPKINIEKEIDKFMEAYYGSAALYIREYFNFMHKEVKIKNIHQHGEKTNPDLVTDNFAKKTLEIFTKAQLAVEEESIYRDRVDMEKFCVLWSDINQRNTVKDNLSITLSEHSARLAEVVKIAKDMNLTHVQQGTYGAFKIWLRSVAPLWLQSEPWYNDPGVDAFITQPMNLFTY